MFAGAAAAAASGGLLPGCVATCSASGAACLQPLATAGAGARPAQRQRRWHSSTSGGGHACSRAGWMPLASDIARQRRLVAASAAAQPALAQEEEEAGWEEAAVAVAVAAQLAPAVELPAADPWRRRHAQASPAAAGAAALAAYSQPPEAVLPQPHAAPALAPPPALPAPPALVPWPATHPVPLPVPNLGYTCMNVELQQRHGVRTNRCLEGCWLARRFLRWQSPV